MTEDAGDATAHIDELDEDGHGDYRDSHHDREDGLSFHTGSLGRRFRIISTPPHGRLARSVLTLT
jgi:hypothetical protein